MKLLWIIKYYLLFRTHSSLSTDVWEPLQASSSELAFTKARQLPPKTAPTMDSKRLSTKANTDVFEKRDKAMLSFFFKLKHLKLI